ncbi:hypothetical protein CDD83_4672 [Cordyceps sp. RAO-2017]|nr:hypothetical protein CDD83_4672 [Cordyceps sp. RAO-2017]
MAIGSGILAIVHAVLAAFLVIELGLTSYVVSRTNIGWWSNTPSQFSFMLFASIWSLLALIYLALAPRFFERLYHGLVALGLLVITTLFWFGGSIAMAAFVGVPDCRGRFCSTVQSAQAAVAFGFFIWAIFTFLSVVEGMASLKGRARADTPARKPGQPYPGV